MKALELWAMQQNRCVRSNKRMWIDYLLGFINRMADW
jgi:hypothetical protein